MLWNALVKVGVFGHRSQIADLDSGPTRLLGYRFLHATTLRAQPSKLKSRVSRCCNALWGLTGDAGYLFDRFSCAS